MVAALAVVVATACATPGTSRGPRPDPVPPADADPAGPALARSPGVRARVTRVVDGDTLEARVDDAVLDIRLIGIDAPESVHPTAPVECFGREAAAYTERRLGGSTILLEWDIERLDRYGRTLAYAWVGRRLFNEDIVRDGYATVSTFPPNVAHVERLVEAERKARRDATGLWSSCLRVIDTGADWRAEDD